MNRSKPDFALVPSAFVTVMSTVPARCCGTSAMITESLSATNVADVFPNWTDVASARLLPKMRTSEPASP